VRPKQKGTAWAKDIRCYKYHKEGDTYRPHKGDWLYLRKRHWLRKYQSQVGCASCGATDHRFLEFDHLNPLEKKGNIMCNKFMKTVSVATLIHEVRTCQVLCSNCHKVKTLESKDFNRKTVDSDKRYESWLEYQVNGKDKL
jgi:5-methylcytosine-specific restriction endonuclease McrA